MSEPKPPSFKKNIGTPVESYDLAGRIVAAKMLEGDPDWDLGKVVAKSIEMFYAALPQATRDLMEKFKDQQMESKAAA